MPLTPQQEKCLGVIKEYQKEVGVFPTHSYIAEKMGLNNREQVTIMFKALLKKGRIKKTPRYGIYVLTEDNK